MDVERHFADRLMQIDQQISSAMNSIYNVALGAPAGAAAILAFLSQSGAGSQIAQQYGFALLIASANIVVLNACVQMRTVFVHAGVRRAIENFIEANNVLPKGLFLWETGPAKELSGNRNLAGKVSGVRYLQPLLGLSILIFVVYFGVAGLARAHADAAVVTATIVLSGITSVTAAGSAVLIPRAEQRVFDWTTKSLS